MMTFSTLLPTNNHLFTFFIRKLGKDASYQKICVKAQSYQELTRGKDRF